MNKSQKKAFYHSIESSQLPRHFREVVYGALRQALAKTPDMKIKRVRTKSDLYNLNDWEARHGAMLSVTMFHRWIEAKAFCPVALRELVEEFRIEMIGKNKEYADFRAAFMTYLTKGYLSKKISQVLLQNQPAREGSVVTGTRGASI